MALVNENADLAAVNAKYVMRITGDDNEGKMELDNFIDPESRFPVVVTTSRLLSTGVDAQTCKLIVLDQRIESMTLFKQIIGRGTRIREEYDKYFFTIMDFKKATELFADPKFDGDPVQIYEPSEDESPVPPEGSSEAGIGSGAGAGEPPVAPPAPTGKRIKYVIDDVPVFVLAERVQYYGPDGKLITESIRDYTRKSVLRQYRSLDSFLRVWTQAEQKAAIIAELEARGVLLDALSEEVGREIDPFDLVCHVAWDQPTKTRKERAENVRKRDYFAKYSATAREVLNALLDKYADEGIVPIEDFTILNVQPIAEIAELLKAYPNCHFHVDATQAVGKIPVQFEGMDTMSLTAHKFYGLNGIGVLVKRLGLALPPLIHGGESTTPYRSGTPTVALACSLALALEKATAELPARAAAVRSLNDRLRTELSRYPKVRINSPANAVPHILNLSVQGVKGTVFQRELDTRGVCVSVKSACSSDGLPSRAVLAVSQDRRNALSSWRISLSHLTTEEEATAFLHAFADCYNTLTQ